MIIKSRFVAVALLMSAAFSCGQKTDKEASADSTATDTASAGNLDNNLRAANEFVNSLPIPYHTVRRFQRAGMKYVPEMTNPAKNSTKYISPYSKSVNLGVYSVDLAYCTFNNQTQEASVYFNSVKDLSDGLNLTSIFESTNLLPRFEKNIGNTDSLVQLIALMSLESDFLMKQISRMDIAYLSFAGGWTEACYIATQMVTAKRNPEILKVILEQNNSLRKLLTLLDAYKDKEEFAALITSLTDIKASLDILNSENTITHEEEFKKLTAKLQKLRSEIVNHN